MKKITKEQILGFANYPDDLSEADFKLFLDARSKAVFTDQNEKTCVLGLDLFQYSQFEAQKQNLIPYLLKEVRDKAVEAAVTEDAAIFQNLASKRLLGITNFIDTGDGGFYMLENPLQALGLMLSIQREVYSYNSFGSHEKFRRIVGPISMRFAMTWGRLFKFHNNYFGEPLIDCARILSKDKLDRALFDENVREWFLEKMGGIESLLLGGTQELLARAGVVNKRAVGKGSVFTVGEIFSVVTQKLEEIEAKKRKLSIYNLFVQKRVSLRKGPGIMSLGNLNSQGINL